MVSSKSLVTPSKRTGKGERDPGTQWGRRPRPAPHSHFHVTRLLVVAEGAGELGLQGACHLLLGGWFPF